MQHLADAVARTWQLLVADELPESVNSLLAAGSGFRTIKPQCPGLSVF